MSTWYNSKGEIIASGEAGVVISGLNAKVNELIAQLSVITADRDAFARQFHENRDWCGEVYKYLHAETAKNRDLETEIEDLQQQNSKLLSALMSMTMQYLSYKDDLFSHDFMSAGEETLALLVELGIMTEVKPSYFKLVKKDEEK